MSVAGFLIVEKPSGVTSFSMVSLVRRLTGVRRVGHAGTLDPLASGVLPIAIGQAARLIEYLDDASKAYEARVHFGITTDTFDAEGEVTSRRDASSLTSAAVEGALRDFVGDIEQRPPAHSAIKLAGKPLYRYAREGTAVEAVPRVVRIEAIELLSLADSQADVRIRCGKGTYIRSLAHDLGERLGCGAHLASLRRTSSGGFGVHDAHSPDELVRTAADGMLESLLLAPDRAVERRPAAILASDSAQELRRGRDLDLDSDSAGVCRAYSTEGEFIGVLRRTAQGRWHPHKVLDPA